MKMRNVKQGVLVLILLASMASPIAAGPRPSPHPHVDEITHEVVRSGGPDAVAFEMHKAKISQVLTDWIENAETDGLSDAAFITKFKVAIAEFHCYAMKDATSVNKAKMLALCARLQEFVNMLESMKNMPIKLLGYKLKSNFPDLFPASFQAYEEQTVINALSRRKSNRC